MTDTSHLEGLDPYDAMDREAARLERYYGALDADGLALPSRCDGWTVRDLLSHLAATEFYFHACLDGTVADLFTSGAEAGLTSLDEFNEFGVKMLADDDAADVLAGFVAANARTRRDFRARDGGEVDTSVGAYPARLQAFHIAAELATHADDAGAPVADAECAERDAWRAAVARFALLEAKPEATIVSADGRTRFVLDDVTVDLTDTEFQAAVDQRLAEDHPLDAEGRAAVSITP